MAADEGNPSMLQSLYPGDPGQSTSQLTTADVSDPSLYLSSPKEVEAYNQYQAANPQTGALANSAYYPDLNNNVAVGNYSGSIVGSNTIYAPGGGQIPLGLMDARDAAIQKAALQRQMDVDKFRSQFKAPTSKLTNINEGLTDEYFGFVKNSWNSALKRAGGDPNRATAILKNNPDFWAKEKSYQDLAKRGDAIVEKISNIDHRVEKGDLLSPALIEAKNKVMMDMNPSSEGFKYLSSAIMRMDADREFSDSANEALKSVVTNKTGKAFNLSNEDDYKVFKKSVEELDPETKKSVIESLKKIYINSSLYPPEYIERNARGLMNYKKTDEDLHISGKADSDQGYDDNSVISESGEKVVSRGKAINSYTEHFVPANAEDQKKELKFSISKDMVSADGTPVAGGETGYLKGSIQGIGVKPFYKRENRFLTDEEVAAVKKRGVFETTDDLEMRPAVIFNVTAPKSETTDSEGNTVTVPGEQKTVYFDTEKIAGIFKGKRKDGNDYEAMRKKTEAYATEKNKDRKTAPAANSGGMISVTVNGKRGQIPADQLKAFQKKYPNATLNK